MLINFGGCVMYAVMQFNISSVIVVRLLTYILTRDTFSLLNLSIDR